MNPDSCPGGCWRTIGRLSKELAKEIQKTTTMEIVIFQQQQRIDDLEHEQAIASGPAMVAEVEQYVAEHGGGS